MPCPALPCHALPCPAVPCHALPCTAMHCHALPCHALSCYALPCPVMPCPALSYPAMPCHATPRHAISCRAIPAAISRSPPRIAPYPRPPLVVSQLARLRKKARAVEPSTVQNTTTTDVKDADDAGGGCPQLVDERNKLIVCAVRKPVVIEKSKHGRFGDLNATVAPTPSPRSSHHSNEHLSDTTTTA